MRTKNVLVVLVCVIGVAAADPRGAEIVYGGGVAFQLHPPTGWVLDADSGHAEGMDAVYLAKGSKFGEAKVIAFAHAMPRNGQPLPQIIDGAIAEMREHAPKLAVAPAVDWTCGKKSGRLVLVAHDPVGNSEALGFLDEGDAVIVIGLLASDTKARTAAMPRLRELCRSYRFLGPVKH
jgi:hypothetical protein